MMRREGEIVVTIKAGQEEDEEHVLHDNRRSFVSQPAHPVVILNGYVRSVRIIDPTPCGLLNRIITATSAQQSEDMTSRDGAIAGPIIRCPDPVLVLDDDDEYEHVPAFVSLPVPKPAVIVPESATGCLSVPDRVPDVPPITEVFQSEEDRGVERILHPTGMHQPAAAAVQHHSLADDFLQCLGMEPRSSSSRLTEIPENTVDKATRTINQQLSSTTPWNRPATLDHVINLCMSKESREKVMSYICFSSHTLCKKNQFTFLVYPPSLLIDF